MLATFIKYASIDSQSDDETPWPCTAGQLEMAQAIAADVKQAIDKSCVREASVDRKSWKSSAGSWEKIYSRSPKQAEHPIW